MSEKWNFWAYYGLGLYGKFEPFGGAFLGFGCEPLYLFWLPDNSEFMEKTFQAAQLTDERFLTIDHSCKIFFDICQTELHCKYVQGNYSESTVKKM